MNQTTLWIVLIVAALVCSASCRPGAVKEVTMSASVLNELRELSVRVIAGFENTVSGITAVLNAPKLKGRQNICVWKICRRPLKKTNRIPEVKPLEIGRKLSDAELAAIWKTQNS
jgi:hypothetical protein